MPDTSLLVFAPVKILYLSGARSGFTGSSFGVYIGTKEHGRAELVCDFIDRIQRHLWSVEFCAKRLLLEPKWNTHA